MIKIFFSHVCNDEQSHALLDWISERIRKDLKQFEPFIACRTRGWNDARELNDHLDESHFFVPVITDEFPSRSNCDAELKRARDRKEANGLFPVNIPIKFGCRSETMEGLGFRINQQTSEGERWIDFLESSEWEAKYDELRERLVGTAIRLNIVGDQDFYKDVKLLDVILAESKPTAAQIRCAIDLCRSGEEYGNYFFRRLRQKEWVYYLKSSGFFQRNPEPIEDPKQRGYFAIPFWPVLDYLEQVSKECDKPENQELAKELMQIIREVTRPKGGKKADNYRTWWYFTKIMANLPTEVITLEDIGLLTEWVYSNFSTTLVGDELGKTLLPKLLASADTQDWEKAAKIIEIVTRIRWTERKYGESDVEKVANTAIDLYWLRELLKKNGLLLGEKCGKAVVEVLKTRVREVLSSRDDLYCYIWRPAIEDHEQNIGDNEARHVLISALRDVLLGYSKSGDAEVKGILRSLLLDDLCVLKRIALYVLDGQYELHGELFWEILNAEIFNSNLGHELYNLLTKHFKECSPERQNQVITIIRNLTREWDKEDDKASLDARLRLKWLLPLKGQGNDDADKLYEEYLIIVKAPPQHPEFASYVEGGSVQEIRPCSVGDLLSKTIAEIVDYLNSFKETGQWETPTEEGLGEVLKEAVKQKPAKFEGELALFLKAKLSYWLYLIRAFEELWANKKIIDWEKVLKFCLSIVESNSFWENADEKQAAGMIPTRPRITSAISSLIESGVKDDEWAFDERHLGLAEQIIVKILQKEPPTAKGQSNDPLTEAMNTPKGHCIEALFNYALRQSRLLGKRGADRAQFWQRIQPVFDNELQLCQGNNFEFSALAGGCLPNLIYLNRTWTEQNIDKIFLLEYESNWRYAIGGYAYVHTVYDEIYKLLREHGHFRKALGIEFENRHIREQVIQNICIAYLRGLEDLNEGLFADLLRAWRENDISEIIRFFWMLRKGDFKEETRNLILNFWRQCYQKIRGQEEAHGAILSDLTLLTSFLTGIPDEEKDWLLQVAPYVDERHNSSFFLEYLDGLTDKNPDAVAEITLKMLGRTAPNYKKEDVRSIVEKLYKAELKTKANEICDAYARKGNYELLRDLYEKYNQ